MSNTGAVDVDEERINHKLTNEFIVNLSSPVARSGLQSEYMTRQRQKKVRPTRHVRLLHCSHKHDYRSCAFLRILKAKMEQKTGEDKDGT